MRQSITLKPDVGFGVFETDNLHFTYVVMQGEDGDDEGDESDAEGWSSAFFAVNEGQLLKFGVDADDSVAAAPERIWSLFEKELQVDVVGIGASFNEDGMGPQASALSSSLSFASGPKEAALRRRLWQLATPGMRVRVESSSYQASQTACETQLQS